MQKYVPLPRAYCSENLRITSKFFSDAAITITIRARSSTSVARLRGGLTQTQILTLFFANQRPRRITAVASPRARAREANVRALRRDATPPHARRATRATRTRTARSGRYPHRARDASDARRTCGASDDGRRRRSSRDARRVRCARERRAVRGGRGEHRRRESSVGVVCGDAASSMAWASRVAGVVFFRFIKGLGT